MATPRPAHILVAEDDGALRDLIVRSLRRDGHHLTVADDAVALEACLAAHRDEIDLVITDVRMPPRSALEVLASLPAPRPAFLLLTAFPDAAVFRDAAELGAECVLAKPFDLDDLRVVVSILIAALT